jgi:1-aminocyclopropane-1-carboxylate deaminase
MPFLSTAIPDAWQADFNALQQPSPITQLDEPLLADKNIQLFIKRDELIDPVIQGNKWRKLKYNLLTAEEQSAKTILSFGGAYSNHLHALAAAGRLFNFNTIGIIRGERPATLSPTLQDMQDWGMQLEFISRADYRKQEASEFIQQLKQKYGQFYLIPEGGNNAAGRQGCAELLDELDEHYDVICCEVGSGTQFSALVSQHATSSQAAQQTHYLGFVVMKNPALLQQLEDYFQQQQVTYKNWSLNHDYHFGGFARANDTLHEFIRQYKQQHGIQLEPVYSGKMLYGIYQLIEQDYFKPGSRILAIHGGGLQGLRGFADNYPDEF